ncbi:MAG: hypothetical protein GWN07_03290 [Actinobacteria bacterium]|nr:hypothetical protein [Actinomycetota bacterium]NIS29149.1 hypothetical protein [Actinomycetota bacterium]NIU64549.1 hypothetical protein [Actinomycetota bacterium]NIW26340.1 hypothetical protein [Actinomycetota bacterium]NIX18908.1 hypothetical protein [Actinomycetota bacterium]
MTQSLVPLVPAQDERHPVARLADTLATVEATADKLAEQGDVAALGVGLGRLREFHRACGDVLRHVEDLTSGLMDADRVEVDGAVLERSKPRRDRSGWQSVELLNDVVRRSRWDPETGERRDDREAFDALVGLLIRYVPFTRSLGWRAGALAEDGYQVDEWCDEHPARRTVKVTETGGTDGR